MKKRLLGLGPLFGPVTKVSWPGAEHWLEAGQHLLWVNRQSKQPLWKSVGYGVGEVKRGWLFGQ